MRKIGRLARFALICSVALVVAPLARAKAQAVVAAWGNVEGIRVGGDVIPFETSLCTANAGGMVGTRTQKERQQPRYSRSGNRRTIVTRLSPFSITEVVEDVKPGVVTLDVSFTADSATTLRGFLCVDAPTLEYSAPRTLEGATTVVFHGTDRARRWQIEVIAPAGSRTIVGSARRDAKDFHRVLIPIVTSDSSAPGSTAHGIFAIRASGVPDHSPVTVAIDATTPGRVFDGLGGNFRIQNPQLDPKVIAYNLANLRVAWGRVEMPWRTWDSDTSIDPTSKDTAQLDPRVRSAMEMARTLSRRGAPVVVSAWFPPQWAVIGPLPRGGELVNGKRGNPLDPAKTQRIYASITSYLLYLKQHYGVEAWAFSFNESDLGIDVRQTPQEHDELIRGLGAYMKSKGLATRMLLGDVSDATPTWFIAPAMQDSAAWPYIAAVSFHSWRGWSDSLLTFWRDAATKIDKPLLIAEGSTDAGAYRYPLIFQEPDMALYEIELYVRMLALSQPRSILQWQLTSDYSLLAGGGLFGDTTALRPTQRFWNLKQLASTPEHLMHLPARCGAIVSCAALGDAKTGRFAVHVVNTGASRVAVVTGVPRGVRAFRVWTTGPRRAMAEMARVPVRAGVARVALEAASFATLISDSK